MTYYRDKSLDPNPSGLCFCGCGNKTKIAKVTEIKLSQVKGCHKRYILGHNSRRVPYDYIEEDKGYKTKCWVWQKYILDSGYGQIKIKNESLTAHKYYYQSKYGVVKEGLELDHLCRVRSCVNPDHLEPVTGTENIRRGSATKLKKNNITFIRNSKIPYRQLAKIFNVDRVTIGDVKRGRTWKDIK